MVLASQNRLGNTDKKVLGLAMMTKERNGGLPAIADAAAAARMAGQLLRQHAIPIPGLHASVTSILVRWMQQNAAG